MQQRRGELNKPQKARTDLSIKSGLTQDDLGRVRTILQEMHAELLPELPALQAEAITLRNFEGKEVYLAYAKSDTKQRAVLGLLVARRVFGIFDAAQTIHIECIYVTARNDMRRNRVGAELMKALGRDNSLVEISVHTNKANEFFFDKFGIAIRAEYNRDTMILSGMYSSSNL